MEGISDQDFTAIILYLWTDIYYTGPLTIYFAHPFSWFSSRHLSSPFYFPVSPTLLGLCETDPLIADFLCLLSLTQSLRALYKRPAQFLSFPQPLPPFSLSYFKGFPCGVHHLWFCSCCCLFAPKHLCWFNWINISPSLWHGRPSDPKVVQHWHIHWHERATFWHVLTQLCRIMLPHWYCRHIHIC